MEFSRQPWECFSHPLVRDLAWCIFSPELIVSDSVDIVCTTEPMQHRELDLLKQLDTYPRPIVQWMENCKSPRLGLRFEAYWQFWLTHCQDQSTDTGAHYEHLFNLQIHSQQQTLGELDVISYCDKSHKLTHRELAVKFYLGIESHLLPKRMQPEESPFCWVGPNIKDRLDLKREQVLHRQLKLLEQSQEARNSLPSHWQWSSLDRQAIVKGRLFYPLNLNGFKVPHSDLGTEHLRGRWLHFSELEKVQNDNWLVLERQQWFAPAAFELEQIDTEPPICFSALLAVLTDHFAKTQQPIQIAAMRLTDSLWIEKERYFIVPDQWPSMT